MRNELINIKEVNGKKLVSARDLHEFLESKQEFTHWIKNRIEQYGFIENEDFTVEKFIMRKTWKHDYIITIDMAKELSMVERNEKGKQARKYFIECEKQLKNKKVDSYMIDDPVERAKRWIEEEEHRRLLSKNVMIQSEIIKDLTPRAELADKVLNSRALVTTTLLAQDYGMTAQQLNKLLNTLGVQYKTGNQWVLYAKYKDMGLMHSETLPITRSNGEVISNNKWTMKGKAFIYKLLKENGILNVIEKIEHEKLEQLSF